MRVQRAPRAADQPQPAPDGVVRRNPRPPAADPPPPAGEAERGAASPFSAEVDLDVSRLADRSPEALLAEVVVRLVTACHREGLVDAGSALRIVAPTDRGMVGGRVDGAVDHSAQAVASLLGALAADLPDTDAHTLTVVDARGTRARSLGDWGLGGGLGVATLGGAESAAVSHRRPSGLVLGQRLGARLALTVPDAARAAQVVRVLDAVARSLEGPIG